jgi:type II secretory pathway pseudopilin PulG
MLSLPGILLTPMSDSKSSFTFVEAIFAILIIGILAGVVLPRFIKQGFIEGLTLRRTSSQIASDIRYTRQLAITNANHYLIKFNFVQNEYSIYKGSILPQNKIGETKKISAQASCSGTDQFDFYSLGNCVFSGNGLLIIQGTSQYKISVELPTGAVVIEKLS